MTQQQYTPVSWQDETTSQQGTLINAERLNQMQTAHHFADGLEEVDTVPTADPGVAYHKIVYCTADSTIYRWDGTQWTADIDDPTRELLEEHLADHDNPHQVTKAQVGLGNCNNTSDADKPISTATQTALDTKLTQRFTTAVGREYVYAYTRTQQTAIEANQGMETLTIPIRDSEGAMHAQVPASPQATHVINYGWANTELDKKADKATTYTKAETDTLLGGKADKATTLAGYGITDAYTKTEADTLLSAKANDNAVVKLTGNQDVDGVKTFIKEIRRRGAEIGGTTASYDIMRGYSEGGTRLWEICSTSRGDNTTRLYVNTRKTDGTFETVVLSDGGLDPSNKVATLGYIDGYLPMVRTANAQTIAGVKTFTDGPVVGMSASPYFVLRRTNYAYTEINSDLQVGEVRFQDKTPTTLGRVGAAIYKTNGLYRTEVAVTAGNVNTSSASVMKVVADTDGSGFVTAPTRGYNAGSAYSSDVATIGTLDAYTPMVRTTGNQTIGGIKTFFSIDPICIKMNNVSWAGPTDTFYLDRLVYNIDKNDRKISEIYSTHDASGQNNTQIVTNAYIDDGNGNYTVPKRAYLNVKVRSTDGKAALIFHAPSGAETTIIDWTA